MRHLLPLGLLALLVLLVACPTPRPTTDDDDAAPIDDDDSAAVDDDDAAPDDDDSAPPDRDQDDDGFETPEDCDDTNPAIHPGATEVCDEVDDDCDGDVVEDFVDVDRDGRPDCVDDDPCAPAPDSLVVWLRGEDDLVDTMGNAVVTGPAASYEAGVVGRAIGFAGGESVTAPDPEPFLMAAGSLSVEMWVRMLPTEEPRSLVNHYECGGMCISGGSPSTNHIFVGSLGQFIFSGRPADVGAGSGGEGVNSETPVDDDQWHHVVGVLDVPEGEMSVYVDGALDATKMLTMDFSGGFAQDEDDEVDPVTFGFARRPNPTPTRQHFTGFMDEVSFYEGALKASEVADLHAAGIAGKCLPTP